MVGRPRSRVQFQSIGASNVRQYGVCGSSGEPQERRHSPHRDLFVSEVVARLERPNEPGVDVTGRVPHQEVSSRAGSSSSQSSRRPAHAPSCSAPRRSGAGAASQPRGFRASPAASNMAPPYLHQSVRALLNHCRPRRVLLPEVGRCRSTRATRAGRRRPARSSTRRTRDSARCGGWIRCTSRMDGCRRGRCFLPADDPRDNRPA